jgi:hypothetical protein
VTGRSGNGKSKYNADFKFANSVVYDGALPGTGSSTPYTLLLSMFEPNEEARFRLTITYKHAQGTVNMVAM